MVNCSQQKSTEINNQNSEPQNVNKMADFDTLDLPILISHEV